MNNAPTATKLVVQRTIDAPIERVFEAWTQPEIMRQWMGPEAVTIPGARLDVREGGAYSIDFRTDDGELMTVFGTYREVRPPERLSFTWSWQEDDGTPMHESLVTIDLHAKSGSQTELVLTHVNLADEPSRDRHQDGWTQTLAKLSRFLAG